jgi:DNA-binding transcriptional MerR regulator
VLDGHVFFTQTAQDAGITISALREWRRKEYFPEPKHHKGRLWLTEHQVLLLKSLKEFFRVNGRKTWKSNKHALKDLVKFVHAQWEE